METSLTASICWIPRSWLGSRSVIQTATSPNPKTCSDDIVFTGPEKFVNRFFFYTNEQYILYLNLVLTRYIVGVSLSRGTGSGWAAPTQTLSTRPWDGSSRDSPWHAGIGDPLPQDLPRGAAAAQPSSGASRVHTHLHQPQSQGLHATSSPYRHRL